MNEFSSNISPLEMAEMNNEDAKQIDVAIGVIINEMPSKIAYIKTALDEVGTKIKSLKTRDVGFSINGEMEYLAKDYDTFSQEVLNYASYYELEIIKVINIFDRQNSLDGSLSVDNNFFKSLPFLGTMLFTLMSYYGNGNMSDDLPQLAPDVFGIFMDRDFNESIGNLIYNGVEYLTRDLQSLNALGRSSLAGAGLIAVESLYDLLFVNTDPRQTRITIVNAVGDGVKLIGGNMIAEYVAVPASTAVSTFVATKLAGFAGAKVIGGMAGGFVGAGIVVLGEITLDFMVEPIVDAITGEALIHGTSIPQNGGLTSLYSDYVKSMEHNLYSYSPVGRTTSLYGMTVSYEYCHAMTQLEPVETLLGLDDYGYSETSYSTTLLRNYIEDLKAIPKDIPNYQEQVDQLTANALVGDGSGYGTDYIRSLIYDLDFDPYSYALNN